jgi:hypothetical protein
VGVVELDPTTLEDVHDCPATGGLWDWLPAGDDMVVQSDN